MADMAMEQAADWKKIPEFKAFWDFLQELGQKQAEAAARFEKEMAERDKSMAELKKIVASIGKNVGGLNCSIGDLVETLFAPHLGEKFEAYNYNLKRQFHRVYIYDENIRLCGEIDILLSDTTVCMAVEVKRWLERNDQVDEHVKRMELIRKYPPAETKGKKLLGAIVGAVVTPEIRLYAYRCGFFVLELRGDDIHLLESPEDFKPKEW